MKVYYTHGRKGVCLSNIFWSQTFPMRGGKFPSSHPCAANAKPFVSGAHRTKVPESTEWTNVPGETTNGNTPLDRFRMRGYWASCFPEGDGMAIDAGDRTEGQVVADIAECFGWKIVTEGRELP